MDDFNAKIQNKTEIAGNKIGSINGERLTDYSEQTENGHGSLQMEG